MYSSCLHVNSGVVCPRAMQEQARQESHLVCMHDIKIKQNELNVLEAKLYFLHLRFSQELLHTEKVLPDIVNLSDQPRTSMLNNKHFNK